MSQHPEFDFDELPAGTKLNQFFSAILWQAAGADRKFRSHEAGQR